jgi:hypothetical protein
MQLRKVKMLALAALLLTLGMTLSHGPAYARMPEPKTVPASLKGTSPHTPSVSHYYFEELVRQGKMTESEALQSQKYMVFRYARRQKDLQAVTGMDLEKRRAYMQARRQERGNPLKEYADFCGFTYERARDLMDIEHGSQKGSQYYQQLKQANHN